MPTKARHHATISACAAALLLAVLLPAPGRAQEPRTPQPPRTPQRTRVSLPRRPATAADEARIIQRMEAVARRLDELEPGTPERRELVEELGNLMLELSQVHGHPGAGERIRVEPALAPSAREHAKVMAQSRQLMVAEGMPGVPRGWVGLNVSAPHSIRLADGEQLVRFLVHPQVVSVDPSSPADRAGIRRGDTVVAYNGTDVREEIAMGRLLRPDSRLAVRVRRDGETRDVTLTVARAPQNVVVRRFDLKFPEPGDEWVMLAPKRAPSAPKRPAAVSAAGAVVAASPQPFVAHFGTNALLGARVEGVSAEMHEATGLPRGVLVMEVAQGSPAAAAGLRPGDVIVSAAGRPVHTVHALRASLQASSRESLPLTIQRKRARRQVELRW